MSRSYAGQRRRGTSRGAFVFLVVGLLAFAAAALSPAGALLSLSAAEIAAGRTVVDGSTLVMSGGLTLISFCAIALGLLLLTLKH